MYLNEGLRSCLDWLWRGIGVYCVISTLVDGITSHLNLMFNVFAIAFWAEVEWRRWGKETILKLKKRK